MTIERAEIVVAGGGPAGAAFALEAARHGRQVTVLERAAAPHHKVCGEFLSRETQDFLHYAGLDPEAMGAARVETLRLVAGKRSFATRLPFSARVLTRHRLDAALLDAARRAGAEVRFGAKVTGIDAADGAVSVRTDRSALSARYAVLASGKHNVRGMARAGGEATAMKMLLAPSPAARDDLDGVVQLAAYDGGYAGACLVEEGDLCLCWLLDGSIMRRLGGDWAEHAAFLAAQAPRLADLLRDAAPKWERPLAVAGLPLGFLRRAPLGHGIYPVGDQLAVIPSYTGDGMAIALATGFAAAHAVLHGRDADAFQAEQIARLAPQFRRAALANHLLASEAGRRFGLAAVRLLPAIAPRLVEMTRMSAYGDLLAGPFAARS